MTGGLMVIVAIATTINNTFWSVLVTENLQIDAAYLSLYYVARSLTMLLFYFTVMPRLRTVDPRIPMILRLRRPDLELDALDHHAAAKLLATARGNDPGGLQRARH